jgi:Ca2+-binding RTX toxin-like protein
MTTTLNVPGSFPTISAAVAAAAPGDTILVAAGYPGGDAVDVTVDNLIFSAPATVPSFTLTPAAGVKNITLADASPIRIVGNTADNAFTGNAGANDISDGGGGNDTIFGGDGDDLITSSGGTDTLNGGNGDDTFLLDGVAPAGTVDGGAGNDTIHAVDLGTYTFSNIETFDTYYGFATASIAQIATFASVTAVLGDPNTRIELSLRGAGGSIDFTTRIGGSNSVSIRDAGLTSAVNITGSTNDDILTGTSFDDTLNGGFGKDLLLGGDGSDILNGGGGDDTLIGGVAAPGGMNQLLGGAGSDTVSYAGQFGTVYADLLAQVGYIGGVQTDQMSSIENLIGGSATSTLVGNDGSNVLTGGDGNDYLYGGLGDDTLSGGGVGSGPNQLWGGGGVDTASYAGTADAVVADLRSGATIGGVLVDSYDAVENLAGGSGDDLLIGTDTEFNVLSGGAGSDVLYGLGEDDTLIGGSAAAGGVNQLWGGAGRDTASYLGTTGKVYASLESGGAYLDSGSGYVATDTYDSIENLVGGTGNDVLVGAAGDNAIQGGAGADILYGRAGIDRFVYGAFGDSTVGGGYDTIADFQSGIDKLDLSALAITSVGQIVIQSDGVSTSVYALHAVGAFDPATDLSISLVGANAITLNDIVAGPGAGK